MNIAYIGTNYQIYDILSVMYGLWCLMPLSTILQFNIVAVSFIGGGNRSTWRKLLTCSKSAKTLSLNLCQVHLAMIGIQTHNLSGDKH